MNSKNLCIYFVSSPLTIGVLVHVKWVKLADLIGSAFGKIYQRTFVTIGQ